MMEINQNSHFQKNLLAVESDIIDKAGSLIPLLNQIRIALCIYPDSENLLAAVQSDSILLVSYELFCQIESGDLKLKQTSLLKTCQKIILFPSDTVDPAAIIKTYGGDYILDSWSDSEWVHVIKRSFELQELRLLNQQAEKALIQRNVELETANHQLRSLVQSVHRYTEKNSYGGLADFICRQYEKEVGADRIYFLLLKKDRVLVYDAESEEEFLPWPVNDGFVQAALEKRITHIPSLLKTENPVNSTFLEKSDTGSLLSLPFICKTGEPKGIILLIKEHPFGFSHCQIDLAKIMASLSGHSIYALQTEAELLRQEELNRQAGKMEAVGRLAGGVAHDFNNLLTAILGYSELIKMEAAGDSAVCDIVSELQSSVSHGASLTQQLLTFSRRHKRNVQLVDPGHLIRDIGKMVKILLTDKNEFIMDLTSEPLTIDADPDQFKQLILNLAINSRDAMPAGGTFAVRTERSSISEVQAEECPEVTQGEYIKIIVTDTGQGMERETLSHIFEPFFTTKEMGKGTGLGLSTVFGIIKQHDGVISVKSNPGVGTEFSILLPLSSHKSVSSQGLRQMLNFSGDQRRILLVEDDQKIQEMTARILEHWNLNVTRADNGIEALQLLRSHQYDLVITDVMMPKMTGDILAARIKEQYPDAKVLFISGYSSEALLAQDNPILDDAEFIQKPFGAEELAEKIHSFFK